MFFAHVALSTNVWLTLLRAMTAPSNDPGTAGWVVRSPLSLLNLLEPAEAPTTLPWTNQMDPSLLRDSRGGAWANYLSKPCLQLLVAVSLGSLIKISVLIEIKNKLTVTREEGAEG